MRPLSSHGLLSLLIFTAIAVGYTDAVQAYRELSIGPKFKTTSGIRAFRTRKNNVLKGSESFAQVGGDMQEFYRRYLMPALTRADYRDDWANLREEVVTDLANATDAKARLTVLQLAYKFCNAVIPDKRFDPATRYNCMLLLGELNQKEARNNSPPVPALVLLPKLMEPLQNEDGLPLLRYAAMMGILRHAELSGHPRAPVPMKAEAKAELAKLLVHVANDPKVPDGVDESANNWLRAKAVEALGYLFVVNEDVVNALAAILVDEQAGLDVRCNAAAAVGRIAGQIDPAQVEDLTGRMAKLTYDCVKDEFRFLAKKAGQREGGNPGPRRHEGDGYFDQEPQSKKKNIEIVDARTETTRRRLLFQLLAIQDGLSGNTRQGIAGLISIAGADAQVAPVVRSVDKLIEKLQDVESDLSSLGGSLELAYTKELPPLVPEKLKRSGNKPQPTEEDETETAAIPIEQADAANGASPS